MNPSEFTPHAYITLSNSGGLEIMLNRSNDGVYYRFNYGQSLESEEIFETEILYTESEDESIPFFRHGENEYLLSEAIRIH